MAVLRRLCIFVGTLYLERVKAPQEQLRDAVRGKERSLIDLEFSNEDEQQQPEQNLNIDTTTNLYLQEEHTKDSKSPALHLLKQLLGTVGPSWGQVLLQVLLQQISLIISLLIGAQPGVEDLVEGEWLSAVFAANNPEGDYQQGLGEEDYIAILSQVPWAALDTCDPDKVISSILRPLQKGMQIATQKVTLSYYAPAWTACGISSSLRKTKY